METKIFKSFSEKAEAFVQRIQQDLLAKAKHNKLSIEKIAATYGVSTFEWTKKVSPDVLTLQDGKSKKALQFRI